jgi:selenocysteine lyase/cysteine desulfurase
MTNQSQLNLDAVRNATPGTQKYIHFNNAGSSLPPLPVIDAVNQYNAEEFIRGGYETFELNKDSFLKTYNALGNLINCNPSELALMENATAAWNAAFLSINFEAGDIILATETDYASNYLAYLRLSERIPIEIKILPVEKSGEVSVGEIKSMLTSKVKLVSITHMPTNGGLVNPVEEIGDILKNSSAFYLVDACQSIGQYPLDVKKIGCHFLSATGRKYLRAPRGTGFLYASKAALESTRPITLDLHSAVWTSLDSFVMEPSAKRYENWEFNYSNFFGLKAAAEYAVALGLENIWGLVQKLGQTLREGLSGIEGIVVQDRGSVQSGIVTFTSDKLEYAKLKKKLADKNIHVAIAPKAAAFLDMENRGLSSMIRSSVHYYNSETEIEKFLRILHDLHS